MCCMRRATRLVSFTVCRRQTNAAAAAVVLLHADGAEGVQCNGAQQQRYVQPTLRGRRPFPDVTLQLNRWISPQSAVGCRLHTDEGN